MSEPVQKDWRYVLAQMLKDSEEALTIPSYNVANLPWAAAHQNKFVLVLDNPQGQARSVSVTGGWRWISEVDGSDLGVGNAGPA